MEVIMKRLLLLTLLVCPLLIFAQMSMLIPTIPGDLSEDEFFEDTDSMEWGFSGNVGTITRNGITYSQLRLKPEINIGKFGFGLDLDFLLAPNGSLRKEDWEHWQDYIDKIAFIRYANRQDPIYFKAGCFSSYSLGNGLIFDNYTNMTRYPEVKNVGAQVGFNIPVLGIGGELFTHNIYKNEILAASAHIKPFSTMSTPYLSDIEIGLNFGVDRDQFAKFLDSDGDKIPDVYDKFPHDKRYWLDSDNDGIPDNIDVDINGTGLIDHPSINPYVDETYPGITAGADSTAFNWQIVQDQAAKIEKAKPLYIGSAYYRLPLVDTDQLILQHYGEFAIIKNHGKGMIFPGFGAKFLIFDAKLEMRAFSDGFVPGFFDRLYDEQRSQLYTTISRSDNPDIDYKNYGLTPKENLFNDAHSSVGWYGFIRANIADFAYLKAGYQDMYSSKKTIGQSLWSSFTITPSFIPNLEEAGIYYSQVHTRYINFKHPRNEAASLLGRIAYDISDSVSLVLVYRETYQDTNKDGRIKGKSEVISTFNVGVQFKL